MKREREKKNASIVFLFFFHSLRKIDSLAAQRVTFSRMHTPNVMAPHINPLWYSLFVIFIWFGRLFCDSIYFVETNMQQTAPSILPATCYSRTLSSTLGEVSSTDALKVGRCACHMHEQRRMNQSQPSICCRWITADCIAVLCVPAIRPTTDRWMHDARWGQVYFICAIFFVNSELSLCISTSTMPVPYAESVMAYKQWNGTKYMEMKTRAICLACLIDLI